VALAAFAAGRRAAAPLLLTADPTVVQQSIDISCPPGPRQQTRIIACGGRMGQTVGVVGGVA